MIYEDANKLNKIIIPVLKGKQPDVIYPSDDVIEAGIRDLLQNEEFEFPQSPVDTIMTEIINDDPTLAGKPLLSKLGRNYVVTTSTTGDDGVTFECGTELIWWNQLAYYDNSDSTSFGITVSPIDTGGLHIYGTSSQAFEMALCDQIPLIGKTNHVFFIGSYPYEDGAVDGGIIPYYYFGNDRYRFDYKSGVIVKYEGDGDSVMEVGVALPRGGVRVDLNFYPQVFDLTEMFGSEYADYIYNLEVEEYRADDEDGAGVELFRQIFPQVYYPFCSEEPRWCGIPGSYYPVNGSVVSVDFSRITRVEDGQYLNIGHTRAYPIKFPSNIPSITFIEYDNSELDLGYVCTFMFYEGAYYLLSRLNNKFSASIVHSDPSKDGRILPSSMPKYYIFKAARAENILDNQLVLPGRTVVLSSPRLNIENVREEYIDDAGFEGMLSGWAPLTLSYWGFSDSISPSAGWSILDCHLEERSPNNYYIVITFDNRTDDVAHVDFTVEVIGYFTKMSKEMRPV